MTEIRTCLGCGDKYPYAWNSKKGATTTKCNRCAKRDAKEVTKRAMLDAAGGACRSCGYKKCLSAITFYDPVARFETQEEPKNREEKKVWASERIAICLNCSAEFQAGMIHLHIEDPKARPPKVFFYTDVAEVAAIPKLMQVGFVDPEAPKTLDFEITKEEPHLIREAKGVVKQAEDA